ncbi:allograft inflammatory factor 1-like isoform X4 [Lingula anatina]|nr:allograft inflammatory factor 1-like isoform X4 [Lingula anatina]|eukprot:XP_013379757.1 allograft inflammatory factor 1-like isoform X4 [Lingula anatina]
MKEAQSKHLERMNRMYLLDDRYRDVDHLQEKLHVYKNLFLEFDENGSGDIDALELKRMLQKLGVHRTNLEIRRMIAEVDSDSSGTITYHEFLAMMLSRRSPQLKLIIQFEAKHKILQPPKVGPPPKKDLRSLP